MADPGARELVTRYEGVLLDAYGVLNDARGPLPAARAFVEHLRAEGVPFLVVTNDASRLPERIAERLAGWGFPVGPADVLASGSLLAPFFAARGLAGARCLVLGTEDSRRFVERAGGEAVPVQGGADGEVIVVADDEGYPFREALEAALNAAFARLERGDALTLVAPNPDLLFPRGDGAYGLAAGALVGLLEAALRHRFPGEAPAFHVLGKPHAPLFAEAVRRLGTCRLLMIGDQLQTDVAGALAAGLDAALLATGVSRAHAAGPVRPTHVLASLGP